MATDDFKTLHTEEECKEYYQTNFGNFEKTMENLECKGQEFAAETVSKYINNMKSARIIDVAAGTGLVGQKLYERGFRNIDALEPCEGMLELAERKHVYNNLICCKLSEKQTNIKQDTYDCLVVLGGFTGGHIPCRAILEMIRIVKPGGIIVNVFGERYLTSECEYRDRLKPFIEELEQKGIWERLERTYNPDYTNTFPGLTYAHRVCTSEIEDFQSSVL